MSQGTSRRAEELFLGAVNLPKEERAAFLEKECGGDASLLQEASALLGHHDRAGGFLEEPAVKRPVGQPGDPPVPAGVRSWRAGEKIGGFEILDVLGRGGMGVVYRARQEQPNRIVALKVVRPGFVSDRLVRRFEHEIELLGRLEHPGIARVYGAGAFDFGDGPEPYFAMELVDGRPLTEYARENRLDLRARLRLLALVADAVQHAHERAVIHRDLKPGNILVDAAGNPRILDFGIARAIDSDRRVTTAQTEAGEILGTLAYMSPEQLHASQDLDTRVDIYALGVIGYELLSGRLPHESANLSLLEALNALSSETAPSLGRLDRTLRGDVEVLIAKAMDKTRERRYSSAAELAEDIRRYLRSEPIVARPPSTTYQLRKLVGRHKVMIGAAAALFVVVSGFAVWMTILYAESNRLRARAEEERRSAEAVTTFLGDMLGSANPEETHQANPTVRQILDAAAPRLETSFKENAGVAAALQATVGRSYKALGFFAEADTHLTRAMELDLARKGGKSVEYANSLEDLASLRRLQGRLDEAEKLQRESLVLSERLEPGSVRLAGALNNLGNTMFDAGKSKQADSLQTRALAIIRQLKEADRKNMSDVLNDLALAKQDEGEFPAAESLLTEALAIDTKNLGPEHAKVSSDLNSLALNLHRQGKREEAEPLYRRALEIQRKVYGNRGDFLTATLTNLGALLREEHRYAEAEPLIRESIAIDRAMTAPGSPQGWRIGNALNSLGECVEARGDSIEAEKITAEAETILLAGLGPDHRRLGHARWNRGRILTKLGRYADAEKELLDGCRILDATLGQDNERSVQCRKQLVLLYQKWGRSDRAKEVQKGEREVIRARQ